ncbi:uncharacterized protein QC763_705890 [Podospora pseudopauciseta]|uniref:Uncharacterized protein n=2 Tax=Podospora TaxID=5144 RepID=A0ABR0H0N8_9PEZI|nr:hypothetical protein QC763_705890 [Podospora pseudopauciseta]KAK4668209.1 hypothetical protein QC764_705890 [Podospora pseudoanserina]
MSSSNGAQKPIHSRVKLFYRINVPHEPEEFIQDPLPAHVELDIPMTCTVKDLADIMEKNSRKIFPSLSVGTRLCFRTMDRSIYSTKPKYLPSPYGSYVIGRGYPGIDLPARDENDPASPKPKLRWLDGAYIVCTIFPPLPSDEDEPIIPPALPYKISRLGPDQPGKGIVVGGDRTANGKGKGREDEDDDPRPPRRGNTRVSKGTSRGPTSRTRDNDRRAN